MKIAVFDLETKRNPNDVDGGWANKKALGISTGVAWVSWEHAPYGRVRMFREDRIADLVVVLEEADVVVSFNGIGINDVDGGFDIPLLQSQGYDPRVREHCDLIRLCTRPHRKFVGLDELAFHTLGWGKSGHGQYAPQLAQAQRWDEVYEYNTDDVALTRDLFVFAQAHGYLLDQYDRIPLSVPGGVPAWGTSRENLHQRMSQARL